MNETEGWSYDDYVQAAIQFEECSEYDRALVYYREAQKLHPEIQAANIGVTRSKNELAKVIYFRSGANYKLVEGYLELRRGMLVFEGSNGLEMEYFIEKITNPRVKLGRLVFDYEGQPIQGFNCAAAKRWIGFVQMAMNGKYPSNTTRTMNVLEKYIYDNFTMDSFEEAVKYFINVANCDSSDARLVVQRILVEV